ncbi:cysteine--tRNA ligase [candidate division WWE3 bacterium CG10_big_fil_rev_8_21_14_0_10_32_10]|uniref:Cysteine--tRNA ligase n=1 Tax=candidate division WWE3 bacterium CG10_big_fil_rev_8_21_14_0_10_32_10 TaxID=1975090 RepID=A0A2H0R9B2_UNCKA|nr:MAG: cysteine--tRNA ligase [candidate division WWE3 bacterium CG10_big_fil_rev_8_21_14_0_10_32_10]
MHDFYLYNSASLEIEKFIPIKKGKVSIYTCGPTVYNTAHIGNFRTYILSDFLVRALMYMGYSVKHVMNITDVGHLAGDGDSGVDKVESEAIKGNTTAEKIAGKYTKEFINDMCLLNFIEPTKMPKASKHIQEQIDIIKILEKKGYTYKTSDGIYFDTSKYKNYATLAHQNLEELQEGARVDVNKDKKNPTDFALWKFSASGAESRLQEWKSPWGIGFPGWHIECSAMSTKYLGQPFDIHVGGEDLLFPHHTNEQAQSFCAHNKNLANYWVHGRFLNIKAKKMAKSTGNFLTLEDVTNRGFEPLALRYYYMTSNYRSPMQFTWGSLEASQVGLNNLRKTLRRWKAKGNVKNVPRELDEKFIEALCDNLNLPKALAVVWGLTKGTTYKAEQKKAAVLKWDSVLGLGLTEYLKKGKKRKRAYIPKDVRALVTKRENYRKDQRFEKGDEIRLKIEERGFTIEDTEHGPLVLKKV